MPTAGPKRLPDFAPRFVWAPAALGLAAIGALIFWLQFSTPDICCGDFDGYYHIHWSRLLWEGIRHGHFPPVFSWLPLTSLNAHDFADQHLFFHLLLIPFLWFAGPVQAAKISAALFATAAVFSCFWPVVRYRLQRPALWLAALLGSSSLFLYRMSMTRAQNVSVVFIMIGLCLLFEEKYRWLAVVAFLYVWTYNLFLILAAMALLWTVAIWFSQGRREWRPLLWTAIGMTTGLVLNPYFPNNLRLLREHIMAKVGAPSLPPGTGMEWYALSSWELFTSSLVAFAAMLAGYIAFGFLLGRRGRTGIERPAFLLLFATLLLLIAARSRRFTEYWPPCAVLFAAFTVQAAGELRGVGERPWDSQEKIQGKTQAKMHDSSSGPTRAWSAGKLRMAVAAFALIGALAYQAQQAHRLIATPTIPDQYREGAQWLREHSPRGAIVFNASWDDFPKLFYYNDANAYVSGLDPIYLSDHSPELGRLYERIVTGKERRPGDAIRQAFGAEYVFITPAADRNFYTAAMLSGQFAKVYQDQQCLILKIRDSDLGADE